MTQFKCCFLELCYLSFLNFCFPIKYLTNASGGEFQLISKLIMFKNNLKSVGKIGVLFKAVNAKGFSNYTLS